MNNKKVLLLGVLLPLSSLVACGPKVIDDSDLVSVDYEYTFSDGTVIDQGSETFTIGGTDSEWLQSIVIGGQLDDEFVGKVNGKTLFGSEYNSDNVQSYPNIIVTEVLGISNPAIGSEVYVSSFGTGVIVEVTQDSDGYDVYVVDFNDKKTYSELSYVVKVVGLEKK